MTDEFNNVDTVLGDDDVNFSPEQIQALKDFYNKMDEPKHYPSAAGGRSHSYMSYKRFHDIAKSVVMLDRNYYEGDAQVFLDTIIELIPEAHYALESRLDWNSSERFIYEQTQKLPNEDVAYKLQVEILRKRLKLIETYIENSAIDREGIVPDDPKWLIYYPDEE